MTEATIKLPAKVLDVFAKPRGAYQYRVLKGGRGSGKSVGAATMAALWGYAEPMRILCVRQFQASIPESFYREIVDALALHPFLAAHYTVTKESITGKNGTQFIFKGLERNPQSIKSLAKIDLTILEEAEDIPEAAWANLEATVFRQPKSEMWVIYNPKNENSPVDFRFVKNQAPNAIVRDINFMDNPFFGERMKALQDRDLRIFDYATYAHRWLGHYLKNSKTQIFSGKFEVKEFTANRGEYDGPYQGLDWGYSSDPTAMVRAWIKGDDLYIEYEAGGTGIELDHVKAVAETIPDFLAHKTIADSAQPSMISHVRRKGMDKIEGAKKGPGSIEDGIAFIRSFGRIYVHPRCKNILEELQMYSWKVDRNRIDPETGQPFITDIPVDAYNHYCIAEGERVLTMRGNIPIEHVTVGDKVMTRKGWKSVLAAQVTGYDKPIVEIETTIGKLRCTPDHPILANGIFTRADALRYGDEVTGDKAWQKLQNGADTLGGAGLTRSKGLIGCISSAASQVASYIFTERYGKASTVTFQKECTFTTLTKTPETTQSKILNACRSRITLPCILSRMIGMQSRLNTLLGSTILQRLGIQRQKASKNIAGLAQWLIQALFRKKRIATTAETHSCQMQLETVTDFAETRANQHGAESQALMMKSGYASAAVNTSRSTNTVKHEPVAGHVLTVKCIGNAKRVYNLAIEECPEFIAGGILTHNCDALRYALEGIMRRGKVVYSTWV